MSTKGFNKMLIVLNANEQIDTEYFCITKLDPNVYLIEDKQQDDIYHTDIKGLRAFFGNSDSFQDMFEGKVRKEYFEVSSYDDSQEALEAWYMAKDAKEAYNKSQIMSEAHTIAKTLEGDYSARMSIALKEVYAKAKAAKKEQQEVLTQLDILGNELTLTHEKIEGEITENYIKQYSQESMFLALDTQVKTVTGQYVTQTALLF